MSEYNKELPLTTDNFFKKLSESIDGPTPTAPNGVKKDTAALLEFIKGTDFMREKFEEKEFLVEGLIPVQGLACLSGMPSSYKSWFGFYLALCVLKGTPVLDKWNTAKGGVLFIDKENIEAQIQKRMLMLGAAEEMEECYFVRGNFTTESLGTLASVVQFVKEHQVKLVIIDSLIRVHSRNENEAVEMNKVFERLAEIQHAGAAVMYLHHLRKASQGDRDPMERLRGSVDISARLDSLIAVESERNFITVVHGKSRYVQAVPSFIMEFAVDKKDNAFFNYVKELEEGQLQGLACEDEVMGILRSNSASRQFLIDELKDKHSRETVKRALNTLLSQQKIVRYIVNREAVFAVNKIKTFLENKEEEDKEKN